jgi:hypothetical protein
MYICRSSKRRLRIVCRSQPWLPVQDRLDVPSNRLVRSRMLGGVRLGRELARQLDSLLITEAGWPIPERLRVAVLNR